MPSYNEVASSYHSVPESLSEILAGMRISRGDDEDEVNRAEEAFPSLNLSDPDISSIDYSSNDSFLDISETSSLNSENWIAASPEQTEDRKTHCLWSCQKSGSLNICSTKFTSVEHFHSFHFDLIILLIALCGFRQVLFLSEGIFYFLLLHIITSSLLCNLPLNPSQIFPMRRNIN
jgi:hypothetical protein